MKKDDFIVTNFTPLMVKCKKTMNSHCNNSNSHRNNSIVMTQIFFCIIGNQIASEYQKSNYKMSSRRPILSAGQNLQSNLFFWMKLTKIGFTIFYTTDNLSSWSNVGIQERNVEISPEAKETTWRWMTFVKVSIY